MVPININGNHYLVPEGLTMLRAMEYAGFTIIKGSGCRAGVCGACSAIYRLPDSSELKRGLACQTVIEPGMNIFQMFHYPTNQPFYKLEELRPEPDQLLTLFPELIKCMGCNTCTRMCPQELNVMGYVSLALMGDIMGAAQTSEGCIFCRLCAAQCPAGITPYRVALVARRIYGRHIQRPFPKLGERIEEIKAGRYDPEIEKLMGLDRAELEKIYRETQSGKLLL